MLGQMHVEGTFTNLGLDEVPDVMTLYNIFSRDGDSFLKTFKSNFPSGVMLRTAEVGTTCLDFGSLM